MESSLLNQGLGLMLVGMGTVFVFLTVLVGVTSANKPPLRRMGRSRTDELARRDKIEDHIFGVRR